MSKKQLGAAQGGEADPQPERLGWVSRLRAQPGFRTAAIAFVLTVVLGVGGTAAYAYWSQQTVVTISGSTAYSLPAPSAAICVTATPNRVEWAPVPGVDPEARYILTFQARGESVSYAVPLGSTSVQPSTLSGLRDEFGAPLGSRIPLTVTMRTAVVATDNKNVVRIRDELVAAAPKSDVSAPLQMFYSTTLWTNYPCS